MMSTCCKRGCCCCNKRDFTVLFGFILAAIAVAVPIVIHETNQEYGHTVVRYIRQYLQQGQNQDDDQQADQAQILEPGQKYKLAIFQLLTDTEDHLPQLGLVAFGLGCANAPLSLLLVCAALFRLPCGLGIWLTGSIIQLVVIGLPLFVYSFLLILYVAVQMNLYVEAACAASIVGLLYLLALIMWLTVLGCYHQMKDMERGMSYRRHGDYEAEGYTRRGQNGSSGHQRRSNGYQLRHFYPTHTGSSSSSRQLPPLPHH
jgi:hypothetical protein